MTLIPSAYLIALLLTMGWSNDSATLIVKRYGNYHNQSLGLTHHTYAAWFFPNERRIEYGSHKPTAVTVDHENQHAWYEYYGLDNLYWIEVDFKEMCRRGVYRACDVINSAPIDGKIHWMHYLINYVGRDKMKIPEPYRTRYYDWMADPPKTEKRYTLRIPLSVRTR